MIFKNAITYRLHSDLPAKDLTGSTLMDHRSHDLHSAEARRIGWASPCGGHADGALSRCAYFAGNPHSLLTAEYQERILPTSVVKDAVGRKVAELEKIRGTKVARAEKQAIKEEVFEELMPRAFVKRQRTDVWVDHTAGRIVVNTSSRKRAEEVLDLLRQTLGSLKVTPLATRKMPAQEMTTWLTDESALPANIAPTDHVVLEARGDDGTVTGRKVDLGADDIQAALASGRTVRRLGIRIEGALSGVLSDDLVLRSIRFDDALLDEANEASAELDDAGQRLDADFVIEAAAMREALDAIISAMGGEAEVSDAAKEPAASSNEAGEADPMYSDAEGFVIESQRASVSTVQRHFKIGYNRAARLIEEMERQGVVSPMDNSGSRKVLHAA